MEIQKIINLLNDSDNESSNCPTKKVYDIYAQNTDYGEGNENSTSIKFKTKVIISSL